MEQNKDKYTHIYAQAGDAGDAFLDMILKEAKRLGAIREEVKSAILVSLPAIGFPAIMALKTALASYDELD